MMAHVLIDVFGRTFFNKPLPGTLNLVSTWWLPIVALTGLALAARRDEHIQANLVYNRLVLVNRRRLDFLGSVVTLAALAAIAWYSLERALRAMTLETSEPVTGLPVWPAVFIVPISMAGFFLEVISTLVKTLSRRQEVPPNARTPR